MKRWLSYSANLAMLVCAGALTISAPDWLSRVIVGIMTGIILLGAAIGVMPLIHYSAGFDRAAGNIRKAQETQASMPWLAISKMDNFLDKNSWIRYSMSIKERSNRNEKTA